MKKKAKKSQGGGNDQEGDDPGRQNRRCIIAKNQEYKRQRAAKHEQYCLWLKTYAEQDETAVLWETTVSVATQAYCDIKSESPIKEDNLRHRLCWFYQLLLNNIKRPHNLKTLHVIHNKARILYTIQDCPKKLTNDKETIKEMMQRLERERDKEFAFIRPAPSTATTVATSPITTTSVEVPDERVPPAVGEKM